MLHLEGYVDKLGDNIDKLGDNKVVQALARELRAQPEEERFRFISQLLDYPSEDGGATRAGLRLANMSLRKREFLEAILQKGLEQENWRWLPLLLDSVTPRLGHYGVVVALKHRLESDPSTAKTVSLARYYLGGPSDNERDREATKELDEALAVALRHR